MACPRWSRAGGLVTTLAVLVAAAVGAAAVLAGTGGPHGPGAYFDSAAYLSMADGLREGAGLLMHDGRPAVIWPPGYPAVIAVVGVLGGLGTVTAARVTNAGAVALVVAAAGLFTHRVTGSRTAAVLAASFLGVSASSLQSAMFVMSEPVFALWYLAAAGCLAAFARHRRWSWLVGAGLATAGAVVTRYIGVAFVPVGITLAAVVAGTGARRRLAAAGTYLAAAGLPVLLLLARNLTVSGTLTGPRAPAEFGLGESIGYLVQALATWVVPTSAIRVFDLSWAVPAAVSVLAASVVALGLVRRRGSRWDPETALVLTLAGMAGALAGVLVVGAAVTKVDPYYQRQLAPLLPGMVVVLAAGACRLRACVPRAGLRAGLTLAMVVTVGGLVGLNARSSLEAVRADRSRGVGGLAVPTDEAAPFRSLASEALPDGTVYSNAAELTYLDTGRRLPYAPPIPVLRRRLGDRPAHILHYDHGRYVHRPPDPDALARAFDVEVVAEAPGGRILRVARR